MLKISFLDNSCIKLLRTLHWDFEDVNYSRASKTQIVENKSILLLRNTKCISLFGHYHLFSLHCQVNVQRNCL